MENAKDIANFVLTLLTLGGIFISMGAYVISKYRKPFEELRELVNDYHKSNDARVKELREELDGRMSDIEENLSEHQPMCAKKFSNDKDSIEQLRRDNNGQARDIDDLYQTAEHHSEGIHLLMQHCVTGNHIDNMKDWMRDTARQSAGRHGGKHDHLE